MIEPFVAYTKYLALYRHFNSSYNYHKYNGKIRANKDNFLKRKDRGQFYRLGVKFTNEKELEEFILSNLIYRDKVSVHNLLDADANLIYIRFLKRKRKRYDYFYKDIQEIISINNNLKEVLVSSNGNVPLIFDLFYQDIISFETLAYLEKIFKYLELNEDIEDPMFDITKDKIRNYMNFIDLSIVKLKTIIKSFQK